MVLFSLAAVMLVGNLLVLMPGMSAPWVLSRPWPPAA